MADLSSSRFNGPLPSSLWEREKRVMVALVALPPSASLSDINIHSIDLFSELATKKKERKKKRLPGN